MHKGIDMIDKAGSWESPDRPDLVWEELSTEHIITDEWIDFRKSTYRFPDGRVFEPYYSYSRRDYVVIVASDENGRFLCVRQFRQGIREVTTEFPAGCIERKDGSGYRSPDSPALTAAADGEKPFPITPSEALKAANDYLILDTPEMGKYADVYQIAQFADATIFVVKAESTDKSAVKAIAKDARIPSPMLVLNAIDMSKKKYQYLYK